MRNNFWVKNWDVILVLVASALLILIILAKVEEMIEGITAYNAITV